MKVVLHKSFGGFYLTPEIIAEMDKNGFDWGKYGEKKLGRNGNSYSERFNDFDFRSDPIFVKSIEDLKARLEKEAETKEHSFTFIYDNYLSKLKIVELNLRPQIEDYHDDIERITIGGREFLD